jgi:uncharacterized membrane protein
MSSTEPPSRRLSTLLLGLALIGLLAAVPYVAPPDGHERATLAQFFGRFHPILVHGPITLLLLVPLLEVAGLFQPWEHLRKTAGLLLWLATLGTFAAAGAGWLLAWSGGYQGERVMNHLWGGLALSAACLGLVWVRKPYAAREGFLGRLLYLPLLLGSIGLMIWTSHQGSAITHGDDFLTKYMPPGLRTVFGVPPAPPAGKKSTAVMTEAPTLFTTQITPILEKNCVSCHKPSKHKGGLRMDTYALLMKGGENGPEIVPGDLKQSELYRRITLPGDDDDFMPSDGKPALKPAEVQLLAQWITAGAKP